MKKGLVISIIIILIIVVGIILYINRYKIISDIGVKGDNPKTLKLTGNEKIKSIKYSYTGTMIGDIYSYEIYKDNNTTKLKVDYLNINDENPTIIEIDNNILDKAMDIVKKHKANRWDGYHKYAVHVLDGSSFSMTINLDNDKSIDISGSNCAPDGYYAFQKELLSLIEKDVKKVKEEYDV